MATYSKLFNFKHLHNYPLVYYSLLTLQLQIEYRMHYPLVILITVAY